MKPGIPWSVKGIDQQARDAAKDAARRSGMTLGEWLNTVIKEEAEQGPEKFAARPRATPEKGRAGDEISSKLDRLAEQLNNLTRQGSETAAGRFSPHAALAAVETHSIASLVDRVERNEREAATLIGDLVQRLDQLEQVSDDLARRPVPELPQHPEDVPGYAALEGALRNVVGHIETNDSRVRDTLKSIQDRLSNLTARADKADRAGAGQAGGSAIAKLAARVDELAGALASGERRESAHQLGGEVAKLSERFETLTQGTSSEVAKLAQRFDALKVESDGLHQRVHSVATQAAQHEAREVERRVQSSLEEARRGAAGAQELAREVKRAMAAVEGFEQRFEEIGQNAASERELRALELSVEQLSATVAQGVGAKPVVELERRLAEFGKRLDSPAPSSQVLAHLGELESRVHHLDARLKEALHAAGDSVSQKTFEAEVRQSGERMAAMEEKFDHLATLERSVAQLFQSLDESRTWAKGVAEDAAREMADRTRSDRRPEDGPSPELTALEAGLHAVKASAESADRRTQETLEAVHETLEQIIGKLAELEAGERTEPAADRRFVPSATSRVGSDSQGSGFPLSSTSHVEMPDDVIADTRRDPEPSPSPPVRPELADLADFDPGPVPLTPAPTADFDTAVVFPGATDRQPTEDPEEIQEDFIAAARRAAQSGNRSQSAILNGLNGLSQRLSASSAGEAADPVVKKRGRFRFPFRRSRGRDTADATPTATATAAPAPAKGSSRKRLILAGLLLLAAVAAYAAQRTNLVSRLSRPAATPSSEISHAIRKAEFGGSFRALFPDGPVLLLASAKQDSIAKSVALTLATSPAAIDLLTTASISTVHSTRSVAGDRLDGDGSFARKANFGLAPGLDGPLPPASDRPAAQPPASMGPESLRKAAMDGDSNAAFIVASRYLEGERAGQDFARAAEWFGRAAKKGLAPAQYRLATLFERGRGVEQSRDAALAWYLRAAGNGNVKSMHNLAAMYADRVQAEPKYELAARWFRAAAQRGLKDSQYNLAVLSERGLGVSASREDAYLWYSLAARQGDQDAERRAAALAKALGEVAVAGLRQRAAQWTADPPIRRANFVAVVDPSWQTAEGPSAASEPQEPASADDAAASTAASAASGLDSPRI